LVPCIAGIHTRCFGVGVCLSLSTPFLRRPCVTRRFFSTDTTASSNDPTQRCLLLVQRRLSCVCGDAMPRASATHSFVGWWWLESATLVSRVLVLVTPPPPEDVTVRVDGCQVWCFETRCTQRERDSASAFIGTQLAGSVYLAPRSSLTLHVHSPASLQLRDMWKCNQIGARQDGRSVAFTRGRRSVL
jgi:hypothetical protein